MAKDRKIDMVILGLLCHEPLTGYDIKKRMDNSIRFFWKGSFGSIYPSLREMEKNGLVRKNENTAKPNGRTRIEYGITEKGKEAVKEWLNTSQVSNELKYETLLKLFFGGIEDKEVSIKNIEYFESEITGELQLLKIYQENLSKVLNENDHIYYYLTVSFGVETYEGYLRWCEKAKKMLKKKAISK